jgi:pullulanase/glycogen debranching enzyme
VIQALIYNMSVVNFSLHHHIQNNSGTYHGSCPEEDGSYFPDLGD